MSDAFEKVWRAYQEGEFHCEICDDWVDVSDAESYRETYDLVLDHHDTEHDDGGN